MASSKATVCRTSSSPHLVELYNQERFPFDRLVEFYDLEEINQAVEDSEEGTVLKPVLRMP